MVPVSELIAEAFSASWRIATLPRMSCPSINKCACNNHCLWHCCVWRCCEQTACFFEEAEKQATLTVDETAGRNWIAWLEMLLQYDRAQTLILQVQKSYLEVWSLCANAWSAITRHRQFNCSKLCTQAGSTGKREQRIPIKIFESQSHFKDGYKSTSASSPIIDAMHCWQQSVLCLS